MHSINITCVFAEEVLLLFEQVMGPVRELDGDTLIVQVTGKSHFCRSCSTKVKTIHRFNHRVYVLFSSNIQKNISFLGIYNKR